MSKNLIANHTVQGGRIGSPAIKAPQTIAVEAAYFVEHRNHDILINDEPLGLQPTEAMALYMVMVRDYQSQDTLGGGVYRLTAAQWRAVKARAWEEINA